MQQWKCGLNILLILFVLFILFTNSQSTYSQNNKNAQQSLRLNVTNSWITRNLKQELYNPQRGIEEFSIIPIESHDFVPVEISSNLEGEIKFIASKVVLNDSSGSQYLPIGVGNPPLPTMNFIQFEIKGRGGFSSGEFSISTTSKESGTSVFCRTKKDGPVEITMKGKNAKVILVYEIPSGHRDFSITIPNGKTVSVKIHPKLIN